jgi:hypothetical protein
LACQMAFLENYQENLLYFVNPKENE